MTDDFPRFDDPQVVGLDVWRQTLNYAGSDPDHVEGVSWSISVLPGLEGQGWSFALVGDLRAGSKDWFLGISTLCLLQFSEQFHPDFDDDAQHLELAKRFGPWGTHILYDTALTCGRRLIATSFSCDIELGQLTPEAEYR